MATPKRAGLDPVALRRAVKQAGFGWKVRSIPATEYHGLGLLRSQPKKVKQAAEIANLMLRARVRLTPPPAPAGPQTKEALAAHAGVLAVNAATTVSVAAAARALPAEVDWRRRGIIGPGRQPGLVRLLRLLCDHRPRGRDGGARARDPGPDVLGGRPALLLLARRQLRRLERGRRARSDQEPRRRARGGVPVHDGVRQPAAGRPEGRSRPPLARVLPCRAGARVPALPHHRLQRLVVEHGRASVRRPQVLPREPRADGDGLHGLRGLRPATAAAYSTT